MFNVTTKGKQMNTKETLYKTAKLREDLPFACWDLLPGEYVSVKYFAHVYEALSGKTVPVYLIRRNLEEAWRGHVFGNALESFVL
jgi:hypothetical protein